MPSVLYLTTSYYAVQSPHFLEVFMVPTQQGMTKGNQLQILALLSYQRTPCESEFQVSHGFGSCINILWSRIYCIQDLNPVLSCFLAYMCCPPALGHQMQRQELSVSFSIFKQFRKSQLSVMNPSC